MGFQASNVQTPSGEIPGGFSVSSKGVELSKQEIEFILTLVKNSTFKGDMISLIYPPPHKEIDSFLIL